MNQFLQGKTNPAIAFFGFGVVGSILLLVLFRLASGFLLLRLGPESAFYVFMGMYIIVAVVWCYLAIGIFKSSMHILNMPIKYLAFTILVLWSGFLLVGMLMAIVLPVLQHNV